MTFIISRRGFVRLLSFTLALILVPTLWAVKASKTADRRQLALERQMMQSMSDLTLHLQNMDNSLQKALYSKTPSMLTALSSKLWREAGMAKLALEGLPLQALELQNTNKLLSQVGDYCTSLSREFAKGTEISEEQRQNLLKLRQYLDDMLTEVLAANDGIQTGSIRLTEANGSLAQSFDNAPPPVTLAEGFTEFEEGFTAYPTLIYDGPFSDHIMERDPLMTQNAGTISRAEARRRAAGAAGLRETQLAEGYDEDGKLPSYAFYGEGADISVSKAGGYLVYLLKSRLVQTRRLSVDSAIQRAEEFLASQGLSEMVLRYYEISSCEMVMNFAAVQGDAVIYPDLVKVTAALDNGEITGYDARGYLVNHRQREELSPALSEEEARASVSGYLTVESARLCVIPSAGLNEVLCWEFTCKSDAEENVLVYINAATGAEEQILILIIGENGQLTL